MVSKKSFDPIIALPNPHLRERSRRVGVVTSEIMTIIDKMQQATLNWEDSRDYEVGVALSAVQMDYLYRIVVVRNNPENKKDRTFTVFINPTITKYEGKITEDYEGCLSIKDIYGRVPRYDKVRIKACDINGKEFRVTASGFLARVFQHEIDHTNGILFIDRIKNNEKAFYCLDTEGRLKELDYESKIKKSDILWQ